MTADAQTLAKIPHTYFEAWNGRDNHALDGFFASTFSWIDPLLPPEGITNLAGAQGFMTGTWTGFSDTHFELIGGPLVDEANGRVAQQWLFTGTFDGEFNGIPPTGKAATLPGVDTYVVGADGLVTGMQAHYDSVSLLRQVGLA